MKRASLVVTALLLLIASRALAFTADDILGIWTDEEQRSKIEIFHCADHYCGKIVWLKEAVFAPGDTHGAAGQPRTDWHNPDPALKDRKLLGLRIMDGFDFRGDDTWGGGQIYDPRSGKTYKGRIRMESKNRLFLKGYVGIPLFGRSTTWTR
ncbi:DUF2147 domain-containing protein [Geomesophilobacter sediminis]|uniref:DUF2147 domain-containing protein n=1 Tax=Geomesophilobacter sediminis TaxID=2798584 RepID=A0A8J7S8I8_9BACT|nr:DUF2147 domain-containing protein [Geomesophilobacter sediminis]MBJ6726501.1 DUF2147 domain-containing protein [Geomesophilobacter sediminis]